MNEDEAFTWIRERFDARAADRVKQFTVMVAQENERQNLISPATVAQIWCRHVVDSAQLILLAPNDGLWLDIGTGGGFPGMVVALLRPEPIALVEPRKLRAAFLNHCVDVLELDTAEVHACSVEHVSTTASVISARAVSSAEKLLHAASRCSTIQTRWLLPRGRSVAADLVDLRQLWHGVFHVEQSLTDVEAGILVIDGVARR